MKKILIIGAGIGQVFIAKKIKARGYYLITVTQKGNYPVIGIADKVYYENVFNKEAVLEIARNEQVNGVISDQNDMMMPVVAYVAEHLGGYNSAFMLSAIISLISVIFFILFAKENYQKQVQLPKC